MPITSYHTVDGRIIGESTDGVRTNYLPDALGNVIATVDETGEVVNTYRYKPSGALLSKTGAGADPKFMWTGTTGSRATGVTNAEQYNRHRHYGTGSGRWTSLDLFWPEEPGYSYARNNPTNFSDPLGLSAVVPSYNGHLEISPPRSCSDEPCNCQEAGAMYELKHKHCDEFLPPPALPGTKPGAYAFCCRGVTCHVLCPAGESKNPVIMKCLAAHEAAHCPEGSCKKDQIGPCTPKPGTGTECAAYMAGVRCLFTECENVLSDNCKEADSQRCYQCNVYLRNVCKPGWIPPGFMDKYCKGC